MEKKNQLEIGFLIELALTGQATDQQFEEVMTRAANEPEVAVMYRQAVAERQFLDAVLPPAEESLVQEKKQQDQEVSEQRQAEEQRIQRQNDLDLGM